MRNESSVMREKDSWTQEFTAVVGEIIEIREHLMKDDQITMKGVWDPLNSEEAEFVCDFNKAEQ